jgi:peptidoglycan/LPS O-acetylase OafA/YrhL
MALGVGAVSRGVGRCSYEIYLTHMLVIMGLMPFIATPKPGTAGIAAWYLALLLSSTALGWAGQRVDSEPLHRVRSRYPGRRVLAACPEADDHRAHPTSQTL